MSTIAPVDSNVYVDSTGTGRTIAVKTEGEEVLIEIRGVLLDGVGVRVRLCFAAATFLARELAAAVASATKGGQDA